jgi:hypothetical protein
MKNKARVHVHTRAPIITDLNYTTEQIAEVKRIQTEVVHTKKKEAIRSVLKGPLCCICHSEIPTKRVEYFMDSVTIIETYCTEHFPIYQNTKDVTNQTLAEQYNIVIGDPNKC